MRAAFAVLFVLALASSVQGHYRLTSPRPRDSFANAPEYIQNTPIMDVNGVDFVCRQRAPASQRLALTAGQTLSMTASGVVHAGDSAVYLTYESIPGGTSDMGKSWFKIANWPRTDRNQNYQVQIPSWVPAGNAVLRWESYALHVRPTIEYYVQCVDVSISRPAGSGAGSLPASQYMVRVPGNLPSDGNQYRDEYNPRPTDGVTGPAVAQAPSSASGGSSGSSSTTAAPAPATTARPASTSGSAGYSTSGSGSSSSGSSSNCPGGYAGETCFDYRNGLPPNARCGTNGNLRLQVVLQGMKVSNSQLAALASNTLGLPACSLRSESSARASSAGEQKFGYDLIISPEFSRRAIAAINANVGASADEETAADVDDKQRSSAISLGNGMGAVAGIAAVGLAAMFA